MDYGFSQSGSAGYQPSLIDVFKVKRYLQSKFPKALVDKIVDDASYWPHSSVYLIRPLIITEGEKDVMYMRTLPLGIPGTDGDISFMENDLTDDGAAWMKKLRIGEQGFPPLGLTPTLRHPCRKIKFQLWSHDQGWGGEHPGTYRASYTWFDVGIQKFQSPTFTNDIIEWPAYLFEQFDEEPYGNSRTPFLPTTMTLQKNVVAKRKTTKHTIVWHFLDSYDEGSAEVTEAVNQGRGPESLNGKFVRSMQMGDCITLWPRARFLGWENHVEKAKVTVYWAL
ncbi:hypothetical protein M405DRAFT_845652 [Rhizopogon salebrosus TDB-379]|nr:hypothetical protein M405DRAFT_845652 [Rhizopogon salebrosus TDB-379]